MRETRGRATGDDGEVRSLPSHLSIPQDVDLKRLSMCSMDSSSEHGGLATDRVCREFYRSIGLFEKYVANVRRIARIESR